MKANEFITEGPISKAGDWLEKQALSRKQKDRAAAMKRKVPAIVKQIQPVLAAQVEKVLKNTAKGAEARAEDMIRVAVRFLEKTLKISSKDSAYDNDMELLISALRGRPDSVATDGNVTKAIRGIVEKSMDEKQPAEKESAAPRPPARFKAVMHNLPKSHDRSDMVYVDNDGTWSLWQTSSRNILEFMNTIDDEDLDAVKQLIRKVGQKPRLLQFTHQKGDYYSVSTRMA